LPSTCSKTVPEMAMPPGSASASSRAATFTPSPMIRSPRRRRRGLRNVSRRHRGAVRAGRGLRPRRDPPSGVGVLPQLTKVLGAIVRQNTGRGRWRMLRPESRCYRAGRDQSAGTYSQERQGGDRPTTAVVISNRKRILWTAGDVAYNRPPHPDFAEAAEKFSL
jgi:hypothetical protein